MPAFTYAIRYDLERYYQTRDSLDAESMDLLNKLRDKWLGRKMRQLGYRLMLCMGAK